MATLAQDILPPLYHPSILAHLAAPAPPACPAPSMPRSNTLAGIRAAHGPMTKPQAQALAWAQHSMARDNTRLHRSAGAGDPRPAVQLLSELYRMRQAVQRRQRRQEEEGPEEGDGTGGDGGLHTHRPPGPPVAPLPGSAQPKAPAPAAAPPAAPMPQQRLEVGSDGDGEGDGGEQDRRLGRGSGAGLEASIQVGEDRQ